MPRPAELDGQDTDLAGNPAARRVFLGQAISLRIVVGHQHPAHLPAGAGRGGAGSVRQPADAAAEAVWPGNLWGKQRSRFCIRPSCKVILRRLGETGERGPAHRALSGGRNAVVGQAIDAAATRAVWTCCGEKDRLRWRRR